MAWRARAMEVYKMVMPWEQAVTVTAPIFATNRIAILPFASFSPDPNDGFFADGITDEIISAVSGISGLNVISRTSVIGYKGTTKKVEEIGRELKVGSILEGTFKKAGNKIRVTTQLIDVAQDKHLWAQNYDRNLDDIFEVQSDVAKQVAEALRVRILSLETERVEKKPTESTEAYTLYLKGRYLWNKRGLDDLKKASECFEQAVKEDPSFALGYAGLADCHLLFRTNWGLEPEANLNRTKAMVTKALEIEPELAEAHATKGLALVSDCDLGNAEEEYKMAIDLKPSYVLAHMWYGMLLGYQQRWDEALEQYEKALDLDPLSPVANINLGGFYYDRRDYRRALLLYKRAKEIDPSNAMASGGMAWAYGRMKMFDEMRRENSEWAKLLGDTYPHLQAWTAYQNAFFENDRETVGRLLPLLETYDQDLGWDPYMIASGHFMLGNVDGGFEWLERTYSQLKWRYLLLYLKNERGLDEVRTDPRYLDLLKRLGLG